MSLHPEAIDRTGCAEPAPLSAHVFVDESKERGLLLAAAVVLPAELARGGTWRSTVRGLVTEVREV
ncbi:hypothetical protein ACPSM1_03045 [Micromonospora chersina]|uniref:hypothetical protein n=1 Tax=Micromonospora chersina TaxID=47854 RepID=UPI003CAFF0C5